MEARARPSPYIHVTTLARYLGDPAACGYAAYFKAHFQYRRASTINPQWLLDHSELVRRRAAALRAEGLTVTVEDANDLRLIGSKTGTVVAGRPDILAIDLNKRLGTIEECKTGTPRPIDAAQARLYLLLVPYTRKAFAHISFTGQLWTPRKVTLYTGGHLG
jgi:hypothetical protein